MEASGRAILGATVFRAAAEIHFASRADAYRRRSKLNARFNIGKILLFAIRCSCGLAIHKQRYGNCLAGLPVPPLNF
jgi:hypothetical protein